VDSLLDPQMYLVLNFHVDNAFKNAETKTDAELKSKPFFLKVCLFLAPARVDYPFLL